MVSAVGGAGVVKLVDSGADEGEAVAALGLTAEIRRDQRLRQTPVALVTSLDTPEDRERGAAAGADAYITKGAFDQGALLQTVNRLL